VSLDDDDQDDFARRQ
jgi:DNA repair exonuclease SbcCD ATPase subunit